MTRVPGSPLLFGSGSATQNAYAEGGAVAAVKGYVFVGYGPPNMAAPVIRSYKVDPTTGELGSYTEIDAGAQNGDMQLRGLVTDPSGHNLYVEYQNSIASFQINSDGTLSFLGSATNLATGFIQGLTVSPTGQLALVMVDDCPPSRSGAGCVGPPDFLLLNRDQNSGALSNSGKLMKQNNVSDVTGPIGAAFDNTGKYFVAWTTTNSGGTNQITVYSVDYTQESLTPVNSYPTVGAGTVSSLGALALAFDPTNSFLYAYEASGMNEMPQSLVVYSFTTSSGALSQIQNQPMPSGTFVGGLTVDDSFVYAITSEAGSMPASIYVFKHDPTGKVGSAVFTQTEGIQVLGNAAELRF